MLIKKTQLDQIEIISNGTIQVRISLIVEDSGNILAQKWHRTAFPPETPIDAQINAVNQHLSDMGYNSISAQDVEKIKAICNVAWTPEIIASYRLINE